MRLSSYKKQMWILIGFLSALILSPAQVSAWSYSAQKIQPAALADVATNAQAISLSETADLNGDGKPECLAITDKTLRITDCKETIFWTSPQSWQVSEAQVGDLNRDGVPEADLLVWRPFQPWPIDKFVPSGGRISNFHNQAGMSCHVILIGWARDGYNELWAGSALIRPVEQLHAVDLDRDGWQELAALEGNYDAAQSGGDLTVWKWDGFGFVLSDEIKQKFTQIHIIKTGNQNWILVQK